jgi:hypothetical protein
MEVNPLIPRSVQQRKKPGPPKGPGVQCVVRLHEPLLSMLDEFCESAPDKPTRAESLRRFAAKALATTALKKRSKTTV